MALQKFDRGQALLGGFPIAELEDGTVNVANGAIDVVTMGPGYAGTADGPLVGTITVRRAVPKAGLNGAQDLHTAVVKQKAVVAMVVAGGKRYTVEGVPKEIARQFAVTSALVENFTIHGKVEVTDL